MDTRPESVRPSPSRTFPVGSGRGEASVGDDKMEARGCIVCTDWGPKLLADVCPVDGVEAQNNDDLEVAAELEEPAVHPNVLPGPYQPTKSEYLDHCVTHFPFRAWCRHCLESRGREFGHSNQQGSKDPRAAAVVSFDYAFISDTSDSSKIKLAPVSSFVTRIVGGSNISVSLDSGSNTYTISYVDITFNPTFNSIMYGNITLQTSSSSVYEAIANNNSSVLNGIFTYTISNGGNVNIAAVEVKCLDTSRISGNALASGSSAGTLSSTESVKVPYNIGTWFNVNTTTIRFNAGTTSSGIANDGTTVVSPVLTDSDTKTAYFGWRFGGCDSTTSYDTVEGFSGSGLTNDLDDMTIAGTNPPWNVLSPSNLIYNNPTTIRKFRINIATNNSHIYFAHSSSTSAGNNDTYGWSPRLYNDAGTQEITNGLIELGDIQIGDGYYRIWKSANIYNAGNLDFNIGGNKFNQ